MDYATIFIDGVRHITDQATLVAIDGDANTWIPLSVLAPETREELSGEDWAHTRELEVATWFAEREGLV